MNTEKALSLLKKKLDEIPRLRSGGFNFNYERDNEEFEQWFNDVIYILEDWRGKESPEYKRCFDTRPRVRVPNSSDQREVNMKSLSSCELALKSILRKYEDTEAQDEIEMTPATQSPSKTGEGPRAFIAHGGRSPALTKLRDFLTALGIKPLVVEDEPSEGRSIGEQVKWCLDKCDCAIVLATKGDIDGKTGDFLPRGNVLNEIGRFQEKFSNRIVYLIESGTKFPSNISEKVMERFTPQSMDKAFIKVARELAAFEIIKAVKPK